MKRFFTSLAVALTILGIGPLAFGMTPGRFVLLTAQSVGKYLASFSAANQNTFALIGDSRMSQHQYFGNSSWGFLNQANAQDGDKYQIIYNGGVSGDTTRQYFAGVGSQSYYPGQQYGSGLAGALASKAKYVVIWGVINDPSSYTGLQIWDSTVSGGEPGTGVLQAVQAIQGNGQVPVIVGETGQNGLAVAAKISQIVSYNMIAREYCARGNCIYLDFASTLWNAATTTTSTINFVANSTQDGTHPNQVGGYLLGKVFDAAFSPLVPPLPMLPASVADSGIANSAFSTQTGGTLSGGGTLTSGTVASGWNISAPAGVSIVITYPADPSGVGSDMQLAITNAAGVNPNISISANPTGNGLTPPVGSQWWGGAYLTVASGSSNAIEPSCYVSHWNGSGFDYDQTDMQNAYNVANFIPTTAINISYSCRTPVPLLGSSPPNGGPVTTNAGFVVNFSVLPVFTANGNATITIARPWLQQVNLALPH